jgi:hypothetical protein
VTQKIWWYRSNVKNSSQETCRKIDTVIARSRKIFSYERQKKRLEYVQDSIGQVFAGVEDTIEYTFDLVDDCRTHVKTTRNRRANPLTGAESGANDREIIRDSSKEAERVLVDVDDIFEQSLEVVRPIVVGKTLVSAKLLENPFDTKHVGVEAGQFGSSLLMEIRGVVIIDRR